MANYDASIRISTKIDNSEMKEAEKSVISLSKKLESLYAKGDKLEALGVSKQSAQWKSLRYDVASTEVALEDAKETLLQLQESKSANEIEKGFEKSKQAAKECFGTIDKGAKKSGNLMSTMASRLKGILLSLLVFNWITKGFNEMVTAMKHGFQNLAQYSSDVNCVFSDMKSELVTLKNSLATAFAPIVTAIIPYLTSLIAWVNKASDTIAQFFAVLSGKSTYTKAKKQVVDYATSLKDATTVAKGALAAFDEINTLNQENTSSGTGEELSGADAFEEAAVDQSKFEWVDWLRDNLSIVLDLVTAIGIGLLAWKIASMFTDSLSSMIGMATAASGAFVLVKNAVNAWENGIDWKNLTGLLSGAAMVVSGLGLAFGSTGAAIGAVISGITLLIVGIHDIMENGVTLQNGLLVVIGTFASVTATVGAAAGAIAAAVAGLVLAVIADWDNFKQTVWEPLKKLASTLLGNFSQLYYGLREIFNGIITFIEGTFNADWETAWEGIKSIFTGIWDAIAGALKATINILIGIINTAYNAIVGVINAIVEALNKINITVPNWVPGLGGKSFGIDIPTIDPVNIPYLATGGIVTSSTIANIGEAGREAVLPLENNTEWMDMLADRIGTDRPIVVKFEGNLAQLGRVLKPVIDAENRRVGPSFLKN